MAYHIKEFHLKILGVDYGERRIGIAIADSILGIAFPKQSINSSSPIANSHAILAIAEAEKIFEIVIGLPISLDGKIHQQGKIVEDFCDLLRQQTTRRIHTMDESYSSAEAKAFLISSGMSPSKNRDQLNAAAAAVILQRWLDTESS